MAFVYLIFLLQIGLSWSYIVPGNSTFRLNGMFPIKCRHGLVNYQSGVMMAEAMRYAVHVVNKNNYLYGYKLEINKLINLEGDTKIPKFFVDTFVEDIPFLIGPYSSQTSYVANILSRIFRQVVISYGATYSDIETKQSYMFRTVPSNIFRTVALIDFINKFKWNYISVINSYGHDGDDNSLLVSELQKMRVCLGDQVDLPQYPQHKNYALAIRRLNKDQRLKVVLLFTNIEDSKQIMNIILELKLQKRFNLFCVFGCTNYIEVIKGNEDVALHTLSMDLHNYEDKGFKKFFLNQKPSRNNEIYFKDFWETLFNCSLSTENLLKRKCTASDKLTTGNGYYPNTPVHKVINAVFIVANVLRQLIHIYCYLETEPLNKNKKCVLNAKNRKVYSDKVFELLLNASYPDGTLNFMESVKKAGLNTKYYDKIENNSYKVRYNVHYFDKINGTYNNIYIGKWEVSRPNLYADTISVLKNRKLKIEINQDFIALKDSISGISCSASCKPGDIRIFDSNQLKSICCWSCSSCAANHISLNDTCKKCRETESVVNNKCKMLPEYHIELVDNPFAIVFVLLSILGLIMVIVVAIIFFRQRHSKIIKASGRDLCFIMLYGILCTFLFPFTNIIRPSTSTCVFRGVLPGLSFLACYAPLFLKTNRIYRIFLHAQKSVSRPPMVSPQSQFLMLAGITLVQVLLSSVWFVSNSLDPIRLVSIDRSHVSLHCKGDESPILMFLNLALSVAFMICCTILAFKTRHFPKNYNEAKYIGVTLYITCVVWSVFLPAYFLVVPGRIEFIREYFMCMLSIVIGYVTLIGLFGQKVHMLSHKDKEPGMLSFATRGLNMPTIRSAILTGNGEDESNQGSGM